MMDWIEDPALRRTTGQELNKGESRNTSHGRSSSIGWA